MGNSLFMGNSALLVIDMLNRYDYPGADSLAANVGEIIEPLTNVIAAAKKSDTPTIYVNDNYGEWNSSREELVHLALEGRHPELVQPLIPKDQYLFVIKPSHSAFYQSTLEPLLRSLETKRLILAGQVTEQCVLYSAIDAFMRDFDLAVPLDTTAALDDDLGRAACELMKTNMNVDLTPSKELL